MTKKSLSQKSATKKSDDSFSLISNSKLLSMYAAMLALRRRASGKATSASKVLGLEATLAGSILDLRAGDSIVADFDPKAIHAVNPLIRASHSLDAARSDPAEGIADQNVTLYFDDANSGTRTAWNSALKLTGGRKLPILYFALVAERASSLNGKFPQFSEERPQRSMPMMTVDASDAVAIYRATSESVAHARKGDGPAFIECVLIPDVDPIENMKLYLGRKGLLDR